MSNNFKTIKSNLITFNKILKNKRISKKSFRKIFLKFDLYNILNQIKPYNKFTASEKEEINEIFKETTKQLKLHYTEFLCEKEFALAKVIVASKKDQIKKIEKVFMWGDDLTVMVKSSKITAQDNVLFIGSGPVPTTPILLNMYSGCKVDCVEQSKKYANISRKIIRNIGLSNKIKVYHKKGQNITKSSYTVIILALLAEPKNQILKRLKKIMSPGTRIVVRTVFGMSSLLYGDIKSEIFDGFKIIEKEPSKIEEYDIYHLQLL